MVLADVAIRRPVTTTMVVLGLVTFGVLGFQRLGLELFPNIDFPIVTITTIYPGADPATVEEQVSRKLEDAVNQVSGIQTLRSISLENVSQVILIFDLEKDINVAAQEVRDKVASALRTLPADIDPPQVEKVDLGAAPVLTLAVTGEAGTSPHVLGEFADKRVKEQLRNIQGVGGIEVVGYRERVIWVRLDATALKRHHVSVLEVVQALKAQNLEIPAGNVPEPGRDVSLKTKGYVASLDELRSLVVMNFMGAQVRLADVAQVEDGLEEETSRSEVNGRPALTVVVRKQSGTNTVKMAQAIKALLPAIQKLAPPGVKVETVVDQSVFIQESVSDSIFDLIFGAVLAVVVIALFLRNLRMTIIAAIAIPTSVIGTFAFMRAMGFTLNYITLVGLSLSVGLLVDDAIVVLENIFRHVERGEDRRKAASLATAEIGLAVTATTFSLVAVFGPIATIGSIVGRFLKQFGMTVAAAVLISLFVSFTLTPMLASRFVREPKPNFFTRAIEKVLLWIEAGYGAIVGWAVRHRAIIVLLAAGVLGATVYVMGLLDQEMMPSMDRGEFQIMIEAPPGSSLEYTEEATKQIVGTLRNTPGVRFVVANVGGGVDQRTERATVLVEIVDRRERDYTLDELQNAIRRRFAEFSKAVVSVQATGAIQVGGSKQSLVQLNVRGPSLEESNRIAERIVAKMRAAGGYTDVETTYRTGKPELGLVPDRERAYALGVPIAYIGQSLRIAMAGDKVSDFRDEGETYDVRMRIRDDQRGDPVTLENMEVRSPSGQLIELRNVARMEPGVGPLSIDRQAGQRQVTIMANLSGKVLGAAVQELDGFIRQDVKTPGYVTDYSGQAQFMAENFRELFTALVLAILLIYFILAAQFESFLHPFTIMLSLPLSVIGGVGALLLTGNSLSMLSMIGFIMLMGLVTKNAILLVDFAIQGQGRGLSANEAVVQAGRIRLRPILMTTAAMVFGMVPIALALSKGSEIRAPMAIAVIGGVLTSTVLTLVVVPVVFSLFESVRRRLGLRSARRGSAQPEPSGT